MKIKDKQIEEMARICHFYDDGICHLCEELLVSCDRKCDLAILVENLYNAGYRKSTNLAEEIEKYILEGASTIQTDNSDALYGAKFAIEKVVLPILEAYKKKYTESEKENG
jgi:hypothetical protein